MRFSSFQVLVLFGVVGFFLGGEASLCPFLAGVLTSALPEEAQHRNRHGPHSPSSPTAACPPRAGDRQRARGPWGKPSREHRREGAEGKGSPRRGEGRSPSGRRRSGRGRPARPRRSSRRRVHPPPHATNAGRPMSGSNVPGNPPPSLSAGQW